ncbi:MAG: hypothetical protein AAF550_14835, partial [Myxococcota bacterium]
AVEDPDNPFDLSRGEAPSSVWDALISGRFTLQIRERNWFADEKGNPTTERGSWTSRVPSWTRLTFATHRS